MSSELIYHGSVKDLYADGGRLRFAYSDRYSVFDWGEMPDAIPHKGEALASLAVSFFDYLAQHGIASHFVEQVSRTEIAVRPVAVLRPEWHEHHYDYGAYRARPTQALVPLEVIFRLRLAQGNSLESRLRGNPALLADLGLPAMPMPAARFDPPLVEFSTKLESTDRYLLRREILEAQILSLAELEALQAQARAICTLLEHLFADLAIELWDGKVEFAYGQRAGAERDFLLVDSIGPDELRLTYRDLPLSKEFLRQIYTRSAWAEGLRRAKRSASERRSRDWKRICTEELRLQPRHLTPAELEAASLLYQALANEVAGKVGRELPFDAAIDLERWHTKARALAPQTA